MASVCVPQSPPSSDMDAPHPLLVMRKRMLSGETKYVPGQQRRQYTRSNSELVREDQLRIIVASNPVPPDDRCSSPSPTRTQTPPPLSPPPTPGRDHDIRWDIEFPTFLPARQHSPEQSPGIKTPEQDDNDESKEEAPSAPDARRVPLRPRFDCAWLIELGSQAPTAGGEVPAIPYAPFCEELKKSMKSVSDAGSPHRRDDIKKYHGSVLPTGKLADLSIGQQAAASRTTFRKRSGFNARCA